MNFLRLSSRFIKVNDFIYVYRWPITFAATGLYAIKHLYYPDLLLGEKLFQPLESRESKKLRLLGEDKPLVSPELANIVNQVLKDISLDENVKSRMKFKAHSSVYFKFCGLSSSILSTNSIIYLPSYFNIASASDISPRIIKEALKRDYNLTVNNSADWLRPEMQDLVRTFILSKRAKEFVITHAAYATNADDGLLKFIYFFLFTWSYFGFWNFMRTKVKLEGSAVFYALYLIVIVIGIFCFEPLCMYRAEKNSFARAISNCHYNFLTLHWNVSPLVFNRNMINGAIDYYEALHKRENILFHILSESGSFFAHLTPKGDLDMLLEFPRLRPSVALSILYKIRQVLNQDIQKTIKDS